MPGRPIRVLLVDDDVVVRRRLAAVLEQSGGVEIVGEARDGLDGVRLYEEVRPDIVLMDVAMPRCDGVQATRRIVAADPSARIVVMAASAEHRLVSLCIAAGARGFLTKDRDGLRLAGILVSLERTRPEER